MRIFGSIQPKSECNFPFLYNLIFKPCHLSSPLTPLWGKIDIYPHGLFCPKFDSENFLFEDFFQNIAYFRQRSDQKWMYFSISIQFNIYPVSSFEAPSSTLRKDRHMTSRTFLSKIQCWKTFIWSFFQNSAYFNHCTILALLTRLQFLQICTTFLQYGIRALWLYIQNCVRSFWL